MFVAETTLQRKKVYEQKNAIQKNYSLGKYYISNEKFKSMESFIVEPGDIIVSCAGTIGEIYILPECAEVGIINQALMKIKLFYKQIESYFIMYFDFVLKKEANEKGNGTGMKNIPSFDILKNMLIPLPPENEINRIILKLNKIIEKIKQLGKKTTYLKKDIEQIKYKILETFFGENSTYKSYYENEYKLGDLLPYEQPGPFIVNSTKYNNDYSIPVLTPGKTFILGYTNEINGIYKVKNSKVILFDDFTTAMRLIDFDFKVKSSAMKILHSSNEEMFNIDYLYYKLQTIKIISDTHKRFWISEYMPLKIKIHKIDEQKKVVKAINDSFTILDSMSKSI